MHRGKSMRHCIGAFEVESEIFGMCIVYIHASRQAPGHGVVMLASQEKPRPLPTSPCIGFSRGEVAELFVYHTSMHTRMQASCSWPCLTACLQEVMREFPDMRMAYGESDEYSFVLAKSSDMYGEVACMVRWHVR